MRRPLALALALGAAACGPLDVRLGYLPDAGPDAGRPPEQCLIDADCKGHDVFCERIGCEAPAGHCQQKPPGYCGTASETVCGCDGVTYFNECWRRQAGAWRKGTGPCTEPKLCSEDAGCPGTAVCARLALACGANQGTCQLGPDRCPASESYQDCGAQGVCLDVCQAAATGRPFGFLSSGPCP